MDDRLFKSLEWRCIGPHRGGRCVAVAGHPTEPGTFYFGGCGGGVWKTTNGGSHWSNVSDGFFATAADWRRRFDRELKDDARPMLILAPMHPVMVVYALDATEGAALPDELRNIEIDLSQTNFLDSCGLGALISLRKTANSRNGKVRLLNPPPRVQLLFRVTRMHKIFEIVDHQEA